MRPVGDRRNNPRKGEKMNRGQKADIIVSLTVLNLFVWGMVFFKII